MWLIRKSISESHYGIPISNEREVHRFTGSGVRGHFRHFYPSKEAYTWWSYVQGPGKECGLEDECFLVPKIYRWDQDAHVPPM